MKERSKEIKAVRERVCTMSSAWYHVCMLYFLLYEVCGWMVLHACAMYIVDMNINIYR